MKYTELHIPCASTDNIHLVVMAENSILTFTAMKNGIKESSQIITNKDQIRLLGQFLIIAADNMD